MSKFPVWQRIIEHLLQLIREGTLRAGQKLPPERELAETLSVSRTSIREALRALVILNVLDVRQGAGTYVTSLEPALLVRHLNLVFQLSGASPLQVFAARKVLEPGIAALAAGTITDAEIERLESQVEDFAAHLDDPEMLREIDLKLHETIADATRNPILIRMMAGIRELGRSSRQRTARIPGMVQKTSNDHRVIVHALKERDAMGAQAAMLVHLNRVEMHLKQTHGDLSKDSGDPLPEGHSGEDSIGATWKR